MKPQEFRIYRKHFTKLNAEILKASKDDYNSWKALQLNCLQ